MSTSWKKYFVIDNQYIWVGEGLKQSSDDSTLYEYIAPHHYRYLYTLELFKEVSTNWGIGYKIDDQYFTKQTLEYWLSKASKSRNSIYKINGVTQTKKELEKILESAGSHAGFLGSTQEPYGDNCSGITQTAIPLSKGADEEEEDDDEELVAKVLAKLEAKMQAVKRHKEILAEVKKLRKSLAEKEAELMESKGMILLEIDQA